MRQRRYVKHRIQIGQRVITGVIAKRAFHPERFAGIDVAFDHKIRVGRHLQIVRLAFHQLDRLFAEITGHQKLVQAIGQRPRKPPLALAQDDHVEQLLLD